MEPSVSSQTEMHAYLANQPDSDRYRRCSLQMDGTLLLSHMDEKRRELVPSHSICLFYDNKNSKYPLQKLAMLQ